MYNKLNCAPVVIFIKIEKQTSAVRTTDCCIVSLKYDVRHKLQVRRRQCLHQVLLLSGRSFSIYIIIRYRLGPATHKNDAPGLHALRLNNLFMWVPSPFL